MLTLILGIFAGTITGLMPGLHINLVALLLFSASGFLLDFTSASVLVCFIVAMTITHTFLDFIPSIFLAAPSSETALSVMPGHELLLQGEGYGACRLAVIGCFLGLIILLVSAPFLIAFLSHIYPWLHRYMAAILVTASLFLILCDKNKFMAAFLFLISGILGVATLSLPLKQPLFPLLTGLFGTSMLFTSIKQKTILPKQNISRVRISKKEICKIIPASFVSSSLCSFLPGLGAAQAAVIGSDISGKISRRGFLVLLGAISTLVAGMNFVAIYAISKPRSGVAVIAEKLLESLTLQQLWLFLVVALVAGSVAFFLSLFFARIFALKISSISYSKISTIILGLLVILCIIFSGWLGLLVLITATTIGIIAIESGTRKMHLMGSIMLPVILWFLPF